MEELEVRDWDLYPHGRERSARGRYNRPTILADTVSVLSSRGEGDTGGQGPHVSGIRKHATGAGTRSHLTATIGAATACGMKSACERGPRSSDHNVRQGRNRGWAGRAWEEGTWAVAWRFRPNAQVAFVFFSFFSIFIFISILKFNSQISNSILC